MPIPLECVIRFDDSLERVEIMLGLCMRRMNNEEFFGELSFAPERRAVQKCKVFHLISLFLSGYNNVVVAWEIMGRQ